MFAGHMKEIGLGGPHVAHGPDVTQTRSRGLKTCYSLTTDSLDLVTWVNRGLAPLRLNKRDMEKRSTIILPAAFPPIYFC